MSVLAILVGLSNSSAQIALHEATDITQTKATLSADFPDASADHGFQYKYGFLPEIDEFSKSALLPTSDPVQINNKSSYAWAARSIKGWIESNPNVPSDQESKITVDVTLYDSSNLTYEWSVDSEDGIGMLSLYVDDVKIQTISGFRDFESVTVPLTAGKHTIAWSYSKTRPSNMGLDIGMLRNISISNTTPDDWIESKTGEISALFPAQKYLYRAYSVVAGQDERVFSPIGGFETLGIGFSDLEVAPITQTTATLNYTPDFGDANADFYYVYGSKQPRHECSKLEQYLLDDTSTLLKPDFSSGWKTNTYSGVYNTDSYYKETIEIDVILTDESTISFQWLCYGWQGNNIGSKTSSMSFYVDDVSKAYISNASWKSDSEKETITVVVPQGVHKLKFETDLAGGSSSWPCFGGIWNLKIPNVSEFSEISTKIPADGAPLTLNNLHPKSVYGYYVESVPNFESPLSIRWTNGSSQLIEFETLGVTFEEMTIDNVTQSSAKVSCSVNNGDAVILSSGLEFKEQSGSTWSNIAFNDVSSTLSYGLSRLKPDVSYEVRFYTDIENLGQVYSEASVFTTLPIIANKPELLKVSQHQAILSGNVIFGDANIYQRGMQFRKKESPDWEEVEDAGNDSDYTCVKKNLEMGATYQARTYIQPAGGDIIYSDILEFTTLDTYFLNCNSDSFTQTTVTFAATLSETDDDASIDYGFEYYIDSDGFFESADSYVKSDIIDMPAIPTDDKVLKAVATQLCPGLGIRWRVYAVIDGDKVYYTSSKNSTWNFAGTDRATITATVKKITQTSISLELDASQDGDAVISQIEYALANSVNDTQPYSICGNTLTLNNLVPNEQYNIRFRGLVNERYCPLSKVDWDYSWFEYRTLPVNVSVSFSGITQTKAKMKVTFDSGDAEISDVQYRLNNGEILPYTGEQELGNLIPGSQYNVAIFAKVNGEEMSWHADSSGSAFSFRTSAVTSTITLGEVSQTAALIGWSSNYGDATFVSAGIEIGSEVVVSDDKSGRELINELTPGMTYYCRSFIETKESGRLYSNMRSFTTLAISTLTSDVSNISNRSATMNGEIDCDSYSSAEFGFQWKQMKGWDSAPAFTKGVKQDDGSISVSLVNGMLEPNTDYQYRTAVRYHDEIYASDNWETFRTESEFIYYPATVYTVFRTDRENNALVMCGYCVAGSEAIVSQGYEYWALGAQSARMYAPQQVITVTTDESMQYTFKSGELSKGNYAVRAFVKTESGTTLYGATLSFSVSEDGFSGIEGADFDEVKIFVEGTTLKVVNGSGLSCYIYDLNGIKIADRHDMSDYEEFRLATNTFYIVRLSNGKVLKVWI